MMTDDDRLLLARLDDKARQCSENSMMTNSDFLDMHSRSVASQMRLNYPDVRMIFYGVFEGAERCIAVFLPEYIGAENTEELAEYFNENPSDNPLAVIAVEKDKFSPDLSHRDYLGALMGLGIRREFTGDINVEKSGCKMAVVSKIAPFIIDNMDKAGRGTLRAKIIPANQVSDGTKAAGVADSFTVSSMRLDSVVKNAFRVSRTEAANAVEGGTVFVNDVECLKPDKKIGAGDKIVFRRKGRIIINSCSSVSKKGRIIVEITRFV
ncbi:MAG: hypothetical protein IKU08_09030 [Clostridia bacterium]|nr:hypothetical protein [Clostridia bacterium]